MPSSVMVRCWRISPGAGATKCIPVSRPAAAIGSNSGGALSGVGSAPGSIVSPSVSKKRRCRLPGEVLISSRPQPGPTLRSACSTPGAMARHVVAGRQRGGDDRARVAFFRSAAAIMAADLAGAPVSGTPVQLCGDAHLASFGGFAAPDRRLVFDVNDFDETLPGPWEWDVKRLAAASRWPAAIADSADACAVRRATRSHRKATRDLRRDAHDRRLVRGWTRSRSPSTCAGRGRKPT